MLDSKTCRYLAAIEKKKTLTEAAKDLQISQSALSQFLGKAEKELHTQLFFSIDKRLVPTPAGEILLRTVFALNNVEQAAKSRMQHYKLQPDKKNTISIGCDPVNGMRYVAKVFADFRSRFPEVTLKLIEGKHHAFITGMKQGTIDLCLTSFTDMQEFDFYGFAKEKYIIAVPAFYFLEKPEEKYLYIQDISELRDIPFILPEETSPLYPITENLFNLSGITPSIIYRSDNQVLIQTLVESGIGAAFIHDFDAKKHSDKVIFCDLPLSPMLKYGIYVRDKVPDAATNYLILELLKLGIATAGEHSWLNEASLHFLKEKSANGSF